MSRTTILCPMCLLLLLTSRVYGQRKEDIRYQSGNIRVTRSMYPLSKDVGPRPFYTILRDHIDFGECFDDDKFQRLPTTYYHPQGPLGLVMKKFNWFPGRANTYHADARLPASLAGQGPGLGFLPLGQLVTVWSEPPVGVIGMNAGTPASYARPFQHFHFYERTKEVIELNDRKEGFFHFIPDARSRGAQVRIIQGPPRKQLHKHGPAKFYKVMVLEACSGENGEKVFLDLLTREGIAECLTHLADDGILCVHTSHRFVNLPPVLAAIARDLKLQVRRGHDQAPGNSWGGGKAVEEARHFSSEWVLLARTKSLLDAVCKTPPNYEELLKKGNPAVAAEDYWSEPIPLEKAWTDKGPNLLHGILRGHPFAMRYSAVVRSCAESLASRLGPSRFQRFIMDLAILPRPVEMWMVEWQLKSNPEVGKLWQ